MVIAAQVAAREGLPQTIAAYLDSRHLPASHGSDEDADASDSSSFINDVYTTGGGGGRVSTSKDSDSAGPASW